MVVRATPTEIKYDDKYDGLTASHGHGEHAHLGGNLVQGDPMSFAPMTWEWVVKRFNIRSMMDLGSGSGLVAANFHRMGVISYAVDGLRDNSDFNMHPTLHWDITQGPLYCPVDLVYCVEMVEHIDERYVENIFETFKNGKYILMTFANPNEPGHHHVNCQWVDYWINHMQSHGMMYTPSDSEKIRSIATQESAAYLARAGLLFINHNRFPANK